MNPSAFIRVHRRLRRIVAAGLLSAAPFVSAAPYGYDDILLGAPFERLARALDFRDIHGAIAAQKPGAGAAPDLGRRGYGCAPREDAYAEVTCVSHAERIDGAPAREIRLHFLHGVLQQFSLAAEMRHFEAVMDALRRRHGEPRDTQPAPPGGYPSAIWRNADSRITAYGGKDLVFVSFELAGYAETVERRRAGAAACR